MPIVLEMTNRFTTSYSTLSAVGRPVDGEEPGVGVGRGVGGGVGAGVRNGVNCVVGAGVGMMVGIDVGAGVLGCCGEPVGVTFWESAILMAWFESSHT